ncbi:sigma factor-like helix-turn-helix DNA-binding protein [Sphingomonas sp. PAMC 26605]|uniref:sigma factor-like helix-turn-helix DNA-binding protein n=1 Tax=Sphingomonas sp. PAMC 26605 TaxID=1112214 RepID=UPI00026CB604|nr:sigma factor-like helix-turn-helix DNA-binding protein [Sphingomonas sp. PAMC 26605]
MELRDIGWALGELSANHRDAVLLAGKGVSIEDAACQLAIPEGTFKSRVARGRMRLRKLIEDRDARPL